MSNPITINPAEVIAMSKKLDGWLCECPPRLHCSRPEKHPACRTCSHCLSSMPATCLGYSPQTRKAHRNHRAPLEDRCPHCDRSLCEPETVPHDCPASELLAFLKKAPKPPFDSGYKKAMLNYALACARWHAGLENVLARANESMKP